MQESTTPTNAPLPAVIDIEGVIGTDESLQFEDQGERIATYEKFKTAVDRIAASGARSLVVNIRSAGGDVNDALLIHDALAASGMHVTTRCYGYVASAATIIAQAASKGAREISSNSLYLIHNSVSRAEGNARSINGTLELLQKTDDRIASVYAVRSGRKQEEFQALMNENSGNGRWLSPRETLDKGLTDRIIRAAPITGDACGQLRALGLPEIPGPAEIRTTTIKSKWKRILAALGLKGETRVEADDRLFDAIESVLGEQTTETVHAAERSLPEDKAPRNAPNEAKQKARPTATLPAEDPAVGNATETANQEAYRLDALSFK